MSGIYRFYVLKNPPFVNAFFALVSRVSLKSKTNFEIATDQYILNYLDKLFDDNKSITM